MQINAHTGKIYEITPRRYFANNGYAQAALYPRWYKQEVGLFPLRRVAIDFLDVAGRVVSRTVSNQEGRYTVPRQELTPLLDGIAGGQVQVNNESGPTVSVSGVRTGDAWRTFVGRQLEAGVSNDKLIAQSMVYYHLQQVVRTASSHISTPWFNRPLRANTNLTRTCNAHWDTLMGTVNFYSGDSRCANSGLIADIIYHEWGHGLDANTGGIVDGAFSEGFSDIVSMVMTRSHIIGPDFGLNGRSVRDLEEDRIHPQDASSSVHSTGLIIGSTFWNLFEKLKQLYSEDEAIEILRRYTFQMIFTAERYTDVYDALLVIDDDDNNLSNGTPHLCLLNEVFARHGLAVVSGECQLVALIETRSSDSGGNGNSVIEPGETIEFNAWLKNTTQRDFVNLRALASSDSPYLRWHNNVAVWNRVVSGNVMRSDTPLSFTISEDAPCGTSVEVNMALNLEGQSRRFSTVLQVGKHTGEPATYNSASLPVGIPDNSSTEIGIHAHGAQWGDTTTVRAAQISFNLFHFAQQELSADLITPEGEVVRVFNGKLGFGGLKVEKDVSDLLRGRRGLGEWRLRITDKRTGNSGYVYNVSLTLTPNTFICQR